MGKQVRSLVTQVKRAFENRDVDAARDLVRQDDVVDNLNKECFQIAIEIGDDADRREWAMTMILVARALERIGDNAIDIGEQIAFIVTGLFREFQDASHPDGRSRPRSGLPSRRYDVAKRSEPVSWSSATLGRNGGWTSRITGAPLRITCWATSPQAGCRARRQVKVEAQRVHAQRSAWRRIAAGTVVVVGVDQRHRVHDGFDQALERRVPELRRDVGVAEVEADPHALGG